MSADTAPQYRPHPSMEQPHGAPQPARQRRTFAIVALVFAALEILTGPLMVLVLSGATRSGLDPSGISLLSGGVGGLSAVLGLIAAAFAITSLVRGEPARLLAGIALGVAISAISALITTWLQFVVFSF